MTTNKPTMPPIAPEKKRINLALQGGGAHGAFTWGVLDRLLEDDRLEIEGLSGTSAGAMNAVATCQGLIMNGNKGAREVLRAFWETIGENGDKGPLKPGTIDRMRGLYTMYNTPAYVMFDTMIKIFSPYQFNPHNIDPLKEAIAKTFDCEILQRETFHKVFLCTTHVREGKIRIFTNRELKPEGLLASGCLPLIHKAVEVDGEYYWDGGFVGNPAIYPLIHNCHATDIVVVQLNPTRRAEIPHDVRGIFDRLSEVSNNMSLMGELHNVQYISDLIDNGDLDKKKFKRINMHCIKDESVFAKLGFSSKLNSTREFLNHLFSAGRKCASEWLYQNFENLGVTSTLNFSKDI